ncbi:phosphotransferase [Fictibacillus iocasae]|uniref:Phosphotransferase n=1 Tax=Fictibacillus iocasae TaxID=2715437 RepID=A0ABW2NTU1_9BACL
MQGVKSLIEMEFPDVHIKSIEKLGEGWRNEAYLVNDELVFRFAKNEAASKELEKEAALLPLLQANLSIEIPQFSYFYNKKDRLAFAGYKLLTGVLLEEDGVSKLNQQARKAIASDLAQFITGLRSFPALKAIKLGAPLFEPRQFFIHLLQDARFHIFPVINSQLQSYVLRRFQAYLDTAEHFLYEPCVVHADLSPDHFILDPTMTCLSGIIDFGDLCVTDPDYEFIYILEDGGEEFTRDVLKQCNHDAIERCLQKLSFFVTFDHIRYVLEGMRRGEEAWILEGLTALEEEMKT